MRQPTFTVMSMTFWHHTMTVKPKSDAEEEVAPKKSVAQNGQDGRVIVNFSMLLFKRNFASFWNNKHCCVTKFAMSFSKGKSVSLINECLFCDIWLTIWSIDIRCKLFIHLKDNAETDQILEINLQLKGYVAAGWYHQISSGYTLLIHQ